ncbi:MAG: hypothetical protein QM813_04895 [Verrucomicrobiota bacterium]
MKHQQVIHRPTVEAHVKPDERRQQHKQGEPGFHQIGINRDPAFGRRDSNILDGRTHQ